MARPRRRASEPAHRLAYGNRHGNGGPGSGSADASGLDVLAQVALDGAAEPRQDQPIVAGSPRALVESPRPREEAEEQRRPQRSRADIDLPSSLVQLRSRVRLSAHNPPRTPEELERAMSHFMNELEVFYQRLHMASEAHTAMLRHERRQIHLAARCWCSNECAQQRNRQVAAVAEVQRRWDINRTALEEAVTTANATRDAAVAKCSDAQRRQHEALGQASRLLSLINAAESRKIAAEGRAADLTRDVEGLRVGLSAAEGAQSDAEAVATAAVASKAEALEEAAEANRAARASAALKAAAEAAQRFAENVAAAAVASKAEALKEAAAAKQAALALADRVAAAEAGQIEAVLRAADARGQGELASKRAVMTEAGLAEAIAEVKQLRDAQDSQREAARVAGAEQADTQRQLADARAEIDRLLANAADAQDSQREAARVADAEQADTQRQLADARAEIDRLLANTADALARQRDTQLQLDQALQSLMSLKHQQAVDDAKLEASRQSNHLAVDRWLKAKEAVKELSERLKATEESLQAFRSGGSTGGQAAHGAVNKSTQCGPPHTSTAAAAQLGLVRDAATGSWAGLAGDARADAAGSDAQDRTLAPDGPELQAEQAGAASEATRPPGLAAATLEASAPALAAATAPGDSAPEDELHDLFEGGGAAHSVDADAEFGPGPPEELAAEVNANGGEEGQLVATAVVESRAAAGAPKPKRTRPPEAQAPRKKKARRQGSGEIPHAAQAVRPVRKAAPSGLDTGGPRGALQAAQNTNNNTPRQDGSDAADPMRVAPGTPTPCNSGASSCGQFHPGRVISAAYDEGKVPPFGAIAEFARTTDALTVLYDGDAVVEALRARTEVSDAIGVDERPHPLWAVRLERGGMAYAQSPRDVMTKLAATPGDFAEVLDRAKKEYREKLRNNKPGYRGAGGLEASASARSEVVNTHYFAAQTPAKQFGRLRELADALGW